MFTWWCVIVVITRHHIGILLVLDRRRLKLKCILLRLEIWRIDNELVFYSLNSCLFASILPFLFCLAFQILFCVDKFGCFLITDLKIVGTLLLFLVVYRSFVILKGVNYLSGISLPKDRW